MERRLRGESLMTDPRESPEWGEWQRRWYEAEKARGLDRNVAKARLDAFVLRMLERQTGRGLPGVLTALHPDRGAPGGAEEMGSGETGGAIRGAEPEHGGGGR